MSKLTEILEQLIRDGQYIGVKEFLITTPEHTANDPNTKAPMQRRLDEAEQAINEYIAEVIGEDDDVDRRWTLVERNKLRVEQRKRAGL